MSIGMVIGHYTLVLALAHLGPLGGQLFEAVRRTVKAPDAGAFLDAQMGYNSGFDMFPKAHRVTIELVHTEPDLSRTGAFTALMSTPTAKGWAVFYSHCDSADGAAMNPEEETKNAIAVELLASQENLLLVRYSFASSPNRGTLIARLTEDPGGPKETRHDPVRLFSFQASGQLQFRFSPTARRLGIQVSLEEATVAGGSRVLSQTTVEITAPVTVRWRNSSRGVALWASRDISELLELSATNVGGDGARTIHVAGLQADKPTILPWVGPIQSIRVDRPDLHSWVSTQFLGSSRSM